MFHRCYYLDNHKQETKLIDLTSTNRLQVTWAFISLSNFLLLSSLSDDLVDKGPSFKLDY